MLKRLSAAVAAVGMAVSGISYAEESYEVYVSTETGITVTTPEINYLPGESISVEFFITNTLGEDKELNLMLDIENESLERVGGTALSRTVKAGKTVPVDFGISGFSQDGILDVNISVYETGAGNEIYVAENGDDSNAGTFSKPLKTVSAAIDKAAALNADEDYAGEDISVIIKDGNYSVTDTVKISEDMTSNFSGFTIKSLNEESVLYGGVSVTGADFTKVTNATELAMFTEDVSDKLYKLNLADFGIDTNFDDGSGSANEPIYTLLYYNGETEQIAKYPNEDYATGTTLITSSKEASVTSDAIKAWGNYDEAWVRGWFIWEWDLVKGRIESISEEDENGERTIVLEQLFAGSVPDSDELPKSYSGKKWYVYNLPQELDIEGEYAIKDNILYYYPAEADVLNGEFENAKIFINTDSHNMFNITADNVTVEGLTFENSGGYFVNAAADNFKLLGCEFRNSSKSAVKITGYNNLVSSCDFHDLGGQGLNLGGGDVATLTKSNSVVENCYFNKTGQISRTNTSALSLSGCGVTARRNTITNTPHLALSYGGNDHVIEYNEITSCLTDNAGDAGLIYTGNNLNNQGTVIRNNYLHDSNSGLGGIYWDDWLSGQSAEGNVFENLNRVLLIHGGVVNKFNNNIIINASYGAQVRGKGRMVEKKVTYKNDSGETVTEDIKFNMWDTAPLMIENKGTINGYNPYGNVFLCRLVGNYYVTSEEYPDLPWDGELWQNAYGHVLKYVNNKTDDLANETELSGNYFVNSENEIYCYAQMEGKEDTLIVNEENTLGATALDAEKQAHYNDVTGNSGIYSNEYRTVE